MPPDFHRLLLFVATATALLPCLAQASMFKGEALDTVADVISWAVLVIFPITVIVVFWLVHILPEKIAEKRKHPQAKAIQVLCLLSLVFGGMLWPIAWLWACSKPVLYKLAYGADQVEPDHGAPAGSAAHFASDIVALQTISNPVWSLGAMLFAPLFTGGALSHWPKVQ